MRTKLICLLLLIPLVLMACKPEEPLPEKQVADSVKVEESSTVTPAEVGIPSDTPTDIPTNVPTDTPTDIPSETPEPSFTPVPPTPTITLPSVISEYLEGTKVKKVDTFNSRSGWDLWTGNISDGQLEIIGNNWNGLAKKGEYSEGEGIAINFNFEEDSEFEFLFDYGEWWTDPYRRFGIYVYQNYPKANLWLGKNGLGFNTLHGNFQPKINTWYTLLMAVDTDGEFLALIWDPTDPSQIFSYHEKAGEKWSGYEWIFRIGANNGTIVFDDFMEITFDAIK